MIVPPTPRRPPGAVDEATAPGDVPAGAARFPAVDDLDPLDRLTVTGSAGLDVMLRTSGASLVAASMLPRTLHRSDRRREAAAMQRYAAMAARGDREAIFVRPHERPRVELVHREFALWRWVPGVTDRLRFPSSYVATDPGARVSYTRRRNGIAWGQHWRHDDGPRPTVVVVHGFMASPYWVNRVFFQLPWWYANGYDLLLVTLPFHGHRARPWQFSGAGLFAGGPARLIEGLLHAVHDIRAWIDHLEETGVEQVGMTGVSLGGYLTALLAAVDDRLCFAIPNAPVTDLVDLLDHWVPAGPLAARSMAADGIDRELFDAAMRVHSPLHHDALLDRDRLFIITGFGDRLAPPSHAERLWEHWGRPAVHAFPGNHVLHVDRGAYLQRIGRFIRGTGFGV